MTSASAGTKRPEAKEYSVLSWSRQTAKGIVWIAGFGAAIATIIGWAQLANAAANPHRPAYEALQRLGTGVTVEHFDFVLGPPAAVIEIPAITSDSGSVVFENVTERIYLQAAHIVTTLTVDEDEVQQYTVLSCDPTFRPDFLTPTGSRVRLNDDPLASADSVSGEPETVYVATGGTASTPMQILDVALSTGDAASRYRGYAYGISDLCASFASPTGDTPPEYAGPIAGLSPEAVAMRDTLPANYYVEIGMSWSLLADGVRFVVPPDESIPAEYLAEVSNTF